MKIEQREIYFVNGIKCICTKIHPNGDVEMSDFKTGEIMFSYLSPQYHTLRAFEGSFKIDPEEQPNA